MPSETSSLLSSSNVLREQLKAACGGSDDDNDHALHKSEFKALLLRRGINVKQAVLEDIFNACDTNHDGSLSVDELFNYVNDTMQPQTSWKDGIMYTIHQTTTSFVWWFAVAFHFAAWVGIVSFIYKKTGRSIQPEWSIVGAWFFFFGAVYFFKLLWDFESDNYDTMTQAKLYLKQSVDKDPAFFDKKAGQDHNLDLYELNAVLEEQALYLPKSILTQIFQQIDTDQSGVITKNEIVDFAKNQTTDPTSHERQAAIQNAVVHTWGFWSLICWFVGSILFLIGAHLSFAGYTEPPLPKNTYLHLYGMGSVMYWLLAFCMVPMLTSEATDYLESIDQMSKAFNDRSQRLGAIGSDQLFKSLDTHRSSSSNNSNNNDPEMPESDGNLDATELYEALIEEGVLISYDTFLELFKSADKSGDGELQVDEFTSFIANISVAKDPWLYAWQMIKRIPFSSSFFGVLMFFIGGLFFTLGSYIDLAHSAGWYFGGAVCYGLASGKNVFWAIMGHWSHFHAVEAGKAKFKARITTGLPKVV